ncbi:MAG: glycosyltransferase family 2 protein [Pseudomonadota bacterium]
MDIIVKKYPEGAEMNKRKLMYLTILITWVASLIHFEPRLFSLFHQDDPWFASMAILFYILCINLFWFYGFFHLFLVVFSLFSTKNNGKRLKKGEKTTKVALLYTTKNDFKERAAISCINQDYADFHLFLLDDGCEEAKKREIDAFHVQHPERTTIIRRGDKSGFKAGNLNNALENCVIDYPYFAVIDADEVIPSDFISKMIPHFNGDPKVGFVQAVHKENPDQPTGFARDMAQTVSVFWQRYLPARQNFGFLMFFGHGAIIRRSVWEEIGGFPEIVSEDLAFSTRMREFGYYGRLAQDVICFEDVPEDYEQFRRRHIKWVKGALEYFRKHLIGFVRSKHVSWVEKIDVVASTLSLYLAVPFILFLLVANVMLPILFNQQPEGVLFVEPLFGKTLKLWPVWMMDPRFGITWSWDFLVVTLISMFSPVFGFMLQMLPFRPKKFLGFMAKSTAAYVSLMVATFMATVDYLIHGKALFLVTGDSSLKKNGVNFAMLFELIFASILVLVGILTVNIGLLAVAMAFLLGPLIYKFGWEKKWLRPILYVPLILMIMMFAMVAYSMVNVQGVFLGMVPVNL